jgi:hypothetical protein
VELQNGKTVAGRVTTADDKVQVSTNSGSVEAPLATVKALRSDADDPAYEKSLHPGILQGWKSGLNLGFALTRGNSDATNLSVGFLATRQTPHDKLGAYMNSVYATNDAAGAVPSTTANAAGGGLRYDHDINPRLFGLCRLTFSPMSYRD